MDRYSFLNQLSLLLLDMPPEERQDALNYYDDYFRGALGRTDEEIIQELGAPQEVAEKIKEEYGGNGGAHEKTEEEQKEGKQWEYENNYEPENAAGNASKAHSKGCWWVFLIVITSPLWFSIGIAVLSILFAVAITVASLCLAAGILALTLLLAGISMALVGVIKCFALPAVGVTFMGAGLILLAVGILLVNLCFLVFGRALPGLVRWIISLFKKPFRRR